jgi:Ohr subfamily peroxiredoxin
MPNGQFSYQESAMTMTVDKVLYIGQADTTGSRNGASRSSDGRLDIKLSSPGAPGNGTNPEQIFAAGWSACFMGAMGVAAAKMKTRLPADAAIDAEVDLCDTGGLEIAGEVVAWLTSYFLRPGIFFAIGTSASK